MKKQDYYNSVTDQVKDLQNLAAIQADKCFDLAKLDTVLGPDTAKKIKRVIITGCGDSYSAAGAMIPAIKALSGLKKCNSPDIMDFCRYYSPLRVAKGCEMDEVLVMSISFSGSADRVAEALTKANDLGCESLLITRTPDSKGGRAAKRVFNVETPDGCNSPGLRSYYASMVGIMALSAYIGLHNGTLDKGRFFEVKQQVTDYTLAFMKEFERIDDQMFEEALRMKDLTKFEVIGDWNEGYSAQFVEQKFIECGGVYCDHTTSEEFAHISFFFRCPNEFGTVILINEDDPSLSRMVATIDGCLAQHRPTLIVTDAADPSIFTPYPWQDILFERTGQRMERSTTPDVPSVCRIPKAPARWMSPLVDYIPGSLLAGYQAAVNEKPYFCGRYDFRTQTWTGR